MKSITKIFGIGIIALIAIVCVGAASAAEVQVGAQLTPTVAPHTYEKGILTIPISNEVNLKSWDYVPCPEPTLPNVHADVSLENVGYFHSGDFPKSFNVDDWNGYSAGEWTPENSEPSSVWLVGSAEDTTSMEFGDI